MAPVGGWLRRAQIGAQEELPIHAGGPVLDLKHVVLDGLREEFLTRRIAAAAR
jgi:hypothetical protein